MAHDALDLRDVLADELVERRTGGYDVAELGPVVALLGGDHDPFPAGVRQQRISELADRTFRLATRLAAEPAPAAGGR